MTRAILIAMLAWLAVAADVALVPSETQIVNTAAKADRLDAAKGAER